MGNEWTSLCIKPYILVLCPMEELATGTSNASALPEVCAHLDLCFARGSIADWCISGKLIVDVCTHRRSILDLYIEIHPLCDIEIHPMCDSMQVARVNTIPLDCRALSNDCSRRSWRNISSLSCNLLQGCDTLPVNKCLKDDVWCWILAGRFYYPPMCWWLCRSIPVAVAERKSKPFLLHYPSIRGVKPYYNFAVALQSISRLPVAVAMGNVVAIEFAHPGTNDSNRICLRSAGGAASASS
jgi:hypothetical protein